MQLYSYGLQLREQLNMLYGSQSLLEIERLNKLFLSFSRCFKKSSCFVASSSGRVELVGNHTDHNGGSVLACAVSRDILAAFLPRDDGRIVLKSRGRKEIRLNLKKALKREANSRGLVSGVLDGLQKNGFSVGGFEAYLLSNVPSGAGMSSSAAFELLIGQIQNSLYNDGKVSTEQLSFVAQYAENEFFSKPCGLLDQSVIALGGIVELDFKDGLAFSRVQNNTNGLNFVVVDSGSSHANLTEHYAAIPAEMKTVANFFSKQRLCEVEKADFEKNFEKIVAEVGLRPALRAKHFFLENLRVKKAVECLKSDDCDGFLEVLNQSGQSSRDNLQNCDFSGSDGKLLKLLDKAKKLNVDGATRVHGGGFAGTILCVVKNQTLPSFVKSMAELVGKNNVHVLKVRQSGAVVL